MVPWRRWRSTIWSAGRPGPVGGRSTPSLATLADEMGREEDTQMTCLWMSPLYPTPTPNRMRELYSLSIKCDVFTIISLFFASWPSSSASSPSKLLAYLFLEISTGVIAVRKIWIAFKNTRFINSPVIAPCYLKCSFNLIEILYIQQKERERERVCHLVRQCKLCD